MMWATITGPFANAFSHVADLDTVAVPADGLPRVSPSIMVQNAMTLTGTSAAAYSDSHPAIDVQAMRKAFGATVAVDDVSFQIPTGTVHAILGENGAGKSTIVKLLSGLMAPDRGSISVFGNEVALSNPRFAHKLGISTAFQEMTLVGDLTVLDAVLLPYAPQSAFGLIQRRKARDDVAAHFDALGLSHVDLKADIRDLDLGIRQKIEIAKALYHQPKILLLDEPTSTLSGSDVDWLGTLIEAERQRGTTLVFISHRLREVRDFCQGLTVLRNGKHIASGQITDFNDDEIIKMIVGRSIGQAFPDRPVGRIPGAEFLRADNLETADRLAGVSLSVKRGEIVGVAGLQGMGQLDLFLACFGGTELTGGQISIDGAPVTLASPVDAVDAKIGISLVPEDRKTEALFLKLSGLYNASLPVIDRFSRFGLIDSQKEVDAVRRIFQLVDVDDRAMWTRVGAFSGGNQQKIAIAKWLLAESRLLLLYDPTRGIDVGTKHEVYQLIRAFADAGGAVLFYSTEIPELVHLADRVAVLYKGEIAGEVSGDAQTEEAIVQLALGASHDDGAAE